MPTLFPNQFLSEFTVKRQVMMLKTQPLYSGAKLNLRDRVLDEVETNSFIALPGKGGQSRLMPSKTMCPNLGEFGEEFYGNSWFKGGVADRIRVCTGPAFL